VVQVAVQHDLARRARAELAEQPGRLLHPAAG
jgi:hypothetical protein